MGGGKVSGEGAAAAGGDPGDVGAWIAGGGRNRPPWKRLNHKILGHPLLPIQHSHRHYFFTTNQESQ